ncbi:thiamine monophosphate kinase [Cellulomonas bogoriensis 69B4 = DSM 16987]|uniref:Thiamine-monophosphate kinase n=1 Tax=Cellulomonas bogoriensis 69B4 = DSM 16987 TaxID=1386082 RepID=A0A0A0BYD9_9CELL|nr:thiamine monophosphate kinase [Cellulomonas bogoriensis 69B4 = DSM 16987]
MSGPVVADLTEGQLLARVFPELPTGTATDLGPGDDAAVVKASDGRVVVSTDVLVEGRHFRRDWCTGQDVGWRAAVQNMADVAAMGARPTALVVGLVAPDDLPVDWVVDLARGMSLACAPHGVGVVGGDLSGGEQVVVAVTVMGDLEGRPPVLRSGARPGDVVAHAGVRGRSAAGLEVLGQGLDRHAWRRVVSAYLRPSCPLGAGVRAATAGATAMMDVSDGLLTDARRMAVASGVVIDLKAPEKVFTEDVQVLAAVASATGGRVGDWLLTGGEDHGLLACFPPGRVAPGFTVVGEVREGMPLVLVEGEVRPGSGGWDHFGAGSQERR